MSERVKELISEEQIKSRLKEMAEQINRDFAGHTLHLITILKGGVYTLCELSKYLTMPVQIDFLSASSYGNGTESSGTVKILKDLDRPVEGRYCLVVEDIIDSGRTLSQVMQMIRDRKPAKLKLMTLLDKPERRVVPIESDYVGFTIEDQFIVGFGLDYAERYRNLPYIATIDFEDVV